MTTLQPSTELTRVHVAGCTLTEHPAPPWAAVDATTWSVECTVEGCDHLATGIDSHPDAADLAFRHRCQAHPRRDRSCATCGGPCPSPLSRWCSTSCHKADEPGAYDEDGPFDSGDES